MMFLGQAFDRAWTGHTHIHWHATEHITVCIYGW